MKVVMAAGEAEFIDELRQEFPDVTFRAAFTPEEQALHVRGAEIVYGWPTRDAFLAADRLRWIQRTGVGINQIMDLPELVDSDVVLTNVRQHLAYPMADHVFAMVLALSHNLKVLIDAQRANSWADGQRSGPYVDLRGRTMGILALGGVGMAVARRARGFEMEVYGVDLRPKPPTPEVKEVWDLERLDDLLRISDWFVVTAPLTRETRGLIDSRRIGLLKEGAYVIVISRGKIVDQPALIEALQSGRLAGAGLDVTDPEPLPEDSPLWDMDNVILSPHTSAHSLDSVAGRMEVFKENLRRFLNDEPLINVCDKRAGF